MIHALYGDFTEVIFLIPDIQYAVHHAEEIAGYHNILDHIGFLELPDEAMLFLSQADHPLRNLSSYMMDGCDLETAIKHMMQENSMMKDVVQT